MKDIELYNDSFQNYKGYQIPKAQLILTDVPYNLGNNAYASNPTWYEGGDNKNGESAKAGKKFFSSENEFRPAEFMHFCSKMLIKEPKGKGKAPCMIMFCEYGVLLYRDKLPKFNNDGQMVFNCMEYPRDTDTPRVHPTQKSVPLLERLIDIFTDKGDVVIDPCAGSGTTLLAAANLNRKAYGFEVNKQFCKDAETKVLRRVQKNLFV